MNTRPPAVTSGPPAPGVPKLVSKCRNFGGWNGISFSMLPSGTSQTIFFLTISTAVSAAHGGRSDVHTSELQSLMRISYAVFCLKKQTQKRTTGRHYQKNRRTQT